MAGKSLKNIFNCIKQECMGAKPLTGDVLKNFREMFGIGDDIEGVFYNEYNIIFTDKQTYESIRYLIPNHETIASIEISEYNENFYIVRYFQDAVLNEVLV